MTRVLGAVLAGGRSSRFGGDKAQALLAGRPLIDHVLAALEPQVDGLVVCGRPEPARSSIDDRPGPDLGPLGGLNAALHHAQAEGYNLVLTTGCDTPDLPADLLAILIGHEPVVLAEQPVIGLWPARLASALDDFLAGSPDRSIRAWMRASRAFEAPIARRIANVNTPADLMRLSKGREVMP